MLFSDSYGAEISTTGRPTARASRARVNTFLPGAGESNDLTVLFLLEIPKTVRSEVFSVKVTRSYY